MAGKVTCVDCIAWSNITMDKGQCKLNPPLATIAQTMNPLTQQPILAVLTFYPETKPDDFCYSGVVAPVIESFNG